jgi:glycosyltransferase involved in cell wall biosynthesis
MKILHVITGLSDGGAEAVLYRLLAHGPEGTHHVISLTDEGKYSVRLRDAGVQVTVLGMPRGRITLRGFYKLWRVMLGTRPDAVQTWMYHADLLGGIAARLARVPVVWGIRNTILVPGRSARSTIWVASFCALLSRWLPVKIVVCAAAAMTVHKAIGYDAQRMVIIPNGYDVSRFSPDAQARRQIREQWGIPHNVPLLGMVARFDPYKNHANLIVALARLHARGFEFCGVLIGTGVDSTNKTLMHLISSGGLTEKVRLLGPLDNIPGVMNALDMHVLSSSAEAFPNVLAEAMACGTPCVTTDVGDAAAILGDTGWRVPSGNPTALADAIEAALADWAHEERWLDRQRRCRQRICDEYALEKMVERYQEIWMEVAALRAS